MALDEVLKRTGLTQRSIAAELGIAEETLSRWANGVSAPSSANLVKLAEYLRRFDPSVREADLLTQDDSAADRPRDPNRDEATAREHTDSGEPCSPVCLIVSGPSAGALLPSTLGSQAPGVGLKPMPPVVVVAGADSHDGLTMPMVGASGGLAPDDLPDPSAVDIPAAPCALCGHEGD